MRMAPRFLAMSLSAGILFVAVGTSSSGQVPAEKGATPPSKAKADGAAKKSTNNPRVPDYFGQIGLSNEQRDGIYKIRKEHLDKIEALRKQIQEQEESSLHQCEALLTETQQKLLKNLREGGSRSGGSSK